MYIPSFWIFDGDEIYFQEEPGLNGKTFKDAIMSYEDSAVMGIRGKDGKTIINPPMDTLFNPGDKVVAISKDDDTIRLSSNGAANVNADAITSGSPKMADTEKTLILGWNCKACNIAMELDNYLAPGLMLTVVAEGDGVEEQLNELKPKLKNQEVEFKTGNISDRELLDSLELQIFNHIILLSYSDTRLSRTPIQIAYHAAPPQEY